MSLSNRLALDTTFGSFEPSFIRLVCHAISASRIMADSARRQHESIVEYPAVLFCIRRCGKCGTCPVSRDDDAAICQAGMDGGRTPDLLHDEPGIPHDPIFLVQGAAASRCRPAFRR